MGTYVFFNFPAHGHVNPTLAIVQELIARGEKVVYYLPEHFRQAIEATGATFRAAPFDPFGQAQELSRVIDPNDGDKRLALLPVLLIQKSPQVVPPLLESVRAEQADCLVYDGMFLWARLVAQILHIPAIALRPSYVANQQSNVFAPQRFSFPPNMVASLNETLVQLCNTYGLPSLDISSAFKSTELLNILFLPRLFQPGGERFDERFLFVGPSFRPRRDQQSDFPLDRLDGQAGLYISFGTVFNNQPDFYRQCVAAFGKSEWRVVLSTGPYTDLTGLPPIPENFIVASHVPQLEVLARTQIFISHGGMNSVMESLASGVPLVVIPQITEEEITARRVQELGLGIALNKANVTVETLREAVMHVSHDPTVRMQVQAMQRHIHEAGGYQRATDAIMQCVASVRT
jgi:MGT family glycosyltransferase